MVYLYYYLHHYRITLTQFGNAMLAIQAAGRGAYFIAAKAKNAIALVVLLVSNKNN